tara:strand:+ start:119 stop:1483 length:1365 start_codon:yes stop_codon:yes gene_type:complete
MAGAKLTKTFSSAGNTKTATQSFWIKRSKISTNMMAGLTVTGGGSYYGMQFLTSDQIDFYLYYNTGASAWQGRLKTNRKFRDTNGWYHFVIAWDTTQGTNTNRLKMYVNGVQETSFEIATYPNQDQTFLYNAAQAHAINGEGGGFFDGQMAHFHYVDGTAYTPTTFGETDATTGIWKPKTSPSGISYGTNGFFLKFDNSANMGLDSAGSNNWTTNGTIVQVKDTPSNVFACLNRLDFDSSNTTLTNINSTLTGGNQGVAYNTVRANMGATKGKWYWEVKAADNAEIDQIGVSEMTFRPAIGNTGGFTSNINAYGVQLSNGYKVGLGQSGAAYMGGFSANDIMMIALDLDNDKITFGKNGQWADGSGNVNQTYGNSTAAFTGLTSTLGYMPTQCMRDSAGNNSGTSHYNFGGGVFGTSAVASAQSPDDGIGVFEYDPPTGFRAWCTKSLTAQEFN